MAQRAESMAEEELDGPGAAKNEQLLKVFRTGKPWREPTLGAGAQLINTRFQ
jgi:hypothetical protein